MVSPNDQVTATTPPSPPKIVFDQDILPVLIDTLGGLESVLERIAVRTRKAPAASLGVAFGLGALLCLVIGKTRVRP